MSISMYDEKVYLNSNSILKYFSEEGIERNKNVLEEQNKYNDIIIDYDYLITKLANFIKSLGYASSLDTSILISYLIDNGYLSIDNSFKKKELDDFLLSRLGLSVLEGYGVCRNYSSFHNDVFKKLDIFDKQLYVYEGIGNGKKKYANHVINLIYFDNNYYGIDTYNGNRLYRFNNEFVLKEISLDFNSKLRYKPYYELTTGESNVDDIKYYIELFKYSSINKYINQFDYDILKHDIIKRIKKDETAFKEFNNNNKKLIKKINSKIIR